VALVTHTQTYTHTPHTPHAHTKRTDRQREEFGPNPNRCSYNHRCIAEGWRARGRNGEKERGEMSGERRREIEDFHSATASTCFTRSSRHLIPTPALASSIALFSSMSTFSCFGPTAVKLGVWERVDLSPGAGLTLLVRRLARLPTIDQAGGLGFVGSSRREPHISHGPLESEFKGAKDAGPHGDLNNSETSCESYSRRTARGQKPGRLSLACCRL
jgi:hypothetical protein